MTKNILAALVCLLILFLSGLLIENRIRDEEISKYKTKYQNLTLKIDSMMILNNVQKDSLKIEIQNLKDSISIVQRQREDLRKKYNEKIKYIDNSDVDMLVDFFSGY